jgi:hypothetical protein
MPLDDDDWVRVMTLTSHVDGAIIRRNRRLLAQVSEIARNEGQAAYMRSVSARAQREALRFDRVGRSSFSELIDHSRLLIAHTQELSVTFRTVRHEARLTRERAERDLRGRTRTGCGSILTPTMLAELAGEMAQLGFTDLSWRYRAAASGFRFASGEQRVN